MAGRDLVAVFVDYENIRHGLWRHFQTRIPTDVSVANFLSGITSACEEIGELYEGKVFGDWTVYSGPEVAREIQRNPHFRPELVLRSDSKKDRTDQAMSFAIDDTFREKADITNFLLCAGDSGYCEVVRRGTRLGKSFYICAVGADTAPELLSVTKAFFPIEQRLGLKSKEAREIDIAALDPDELKRWEPLVKLLDRAEQRLPYVVKSYFVNMWLVPALGYGDTFEQKVAIVDLGIESRLLLQDSVSDPATGRPVRAIRLNRENPIVATILGSQ